MKENCLNCRFWFKDAADGYSDDELYSECRRFPPPSGHHGKKANRQIDANSFSGKFPLTMDWEWCGEWKAMGENHESQS